MVVELGLLKELLRDSDSELLELKQHRTELETKVTFLQSKVNERNDDLIQLHGGNNELKHRFSEQEFKTEDLRKYLAHSKDLLEKADLKASQLHARNVDLEKQLLVIQESLQMENAENESMQKQLAAKVQELDLSTIEWKELILKLQNAMSNLEIQTKGEANYLRGLSSSSWIAVGFSSGHCRLLDLKSGSIIAHCRAHDGFVTKLAAVDEHLIVSSSLDRTLRLWDLRRSSGGTEMEFLVFSFGVMICFLHLEVRLAFLSF